MARNLNMILTGPFSAKAHNPLNRSQREVDQTRVRTVLLQLTLLQGTSAAGHLLPSTALCVRVSKLRALPREASQAKGNEKGLSWNKSLGIF